MNHIVIIGGDSFVFLYHKEVIKGFRRQGGTQTV